MKKKLITYTILVTLLLVILSTYPVNKVSAKTNTIQEEFVIECESESEDPDTAIVDEYIEEDIAQEKKDTPLEDPKVAPKRNYPLLITVTILILITIWTIRNVLSPASSK